MNTERLVREVEKRLVGLPGHHRSEILDALREEISRERRRVDPAPTVEAERERRREAETLREVLEAINRHADLEQTAAEVLKQLSRMIVFDSCCLCLAEARGFRILAVRGFLEPSMAIGTLVQNALSEDIRENRWPLSVADVQEDDRYVPIPGADAIRSWSGLPLLVEGQVLGLLILHRHQLVAFGEEDIHRAKIVAFSAAAAIRKAQLHEQLRRYAVLMERVVAVDQAVFQRVPREQLARIILEGAVRIGGHSAGLLVLEEPSGGQVTAAAGDDFEGAAGRPAPPELGTQPAGRLEEDLATAMCAALDLPDPAQGLWLVPLGSPPTRIGTLALLGHGPHDTLMEAYASRAATAFLHAVGQR